MNEVEYKALVDKLKADLAPLEAKAKQLAEDAVKNGGISKDAFEAYQAQVKTATEKLEDICKTQGTTLAELQERMNSGSVGSKSIAQVLEENKDELKKVFVNGSGTKQFVVGLNAKGEWAMKPHDPVKAAGPHASIADVGGSGNVASIAQSIDAASLLRLGGSSPIISQFRNTPWVFDLCNLQNSSIDSPFAMWFEETAKQGASATVAEGATKPLTQYAYELKTATYKKEATLIGMTDEFSIDFSRLESDIMGKGRTDVINRINTAILANIVSNATAYNTSASFGTVSNANDFDVIAAMAAQVENATYGSLANAAVTSTFKKYRMGVEKNGFASYLNRPDVLANIAFIGNPAMAADNVLVGDFKNYNIILKGGFIVKVGYNGTDFAENKFSIVMEQYYFDYISAIRQVAIVKGTTFAAVKALIDSGS